MAKSTLRIATRASQLARWQATWVAARLAERGVQTAIVEAASRGDIEQTDPVASIGATGVFTKEIQAAVLAGDADVAVHSLKDLPTAITPGMLLAAIPEREDLADALVARQEQGESVFASFAELPQGARVGTGSLRRRAQLLYLRPDLAVSGIRGNVDTRLRKLDSGEFDAIILAAAGLTRLGWRGRITERLGPPATLPAPGQGALAVECRAEDDATARLLAPLEHTATRVAVVAERALLADLEGGCSAPIAAWGRIDEGALQLDGLVAAIDGSRVIRASAGQRLPSDAKELGRKVAEALRRQGAEELVGAARG